MKTVIQTPIDDVDGEMPLTIDSRDYECMIAQSAKLARNLILDYERVIAERDALAEALRKIHDGNEMRDKSSFTRAEVVERYQSIARAALAKIGETKFTVENEKL